ncbi:MAG: universal stress protein [Hahellaceae bacterium]|nr:universal stress protein [Hahellaceae bacterium]MCP5211964.1 universal stress protein [Hahellaceae bacterium]
MQIKKMLVVLDSRFNTQPVVAKAMFLAKQYNAEVELAVFDHCNALVSSYLFDKVGLEEAKAGYMRGKEKWAADFAALMIKNGLNVTVYTEWSKHSGKSIVERAVTTNVDLIVKGTHQHSLIERAFMTHTDWQLMRETPVPLLFIREREWGSAISVSAAVDPLANDDELAIEKNSATSVTLDHQILAVAHDLACKLPAELSAIHAYEPLTTGMVAEFDTLIANYADYREAVMKKHRQALDGLLKSDVERGCIVYFEEGAAEKVVPEVIEREAIDIIVLGAVARSGVDRIVIGSTAERLLDNILCDLLVVRGQAAEHQ